MCVLWWSSRFLHGQLRHATREMAPTCPTHSLRHLSCAASMPPSQTAKCLPIPQLRPLAQHSVGIDALYIIWIHMGRNWVKERLKRTNHRKSTPAHHKLIMDRDFSFQAVLQEVITDWRYPFLLLVTNMVQPCAAKRFHLAQLLSYQTTCHYLVLARTDLKKYATNDCLWLQ